MALPDAAYARLLALRTGLRHFQAWSAKQARAAGLTPAQHQLLLAIRGHGDARGPTIGEAADHLLLRHHSAVELVDRAVVAGLVHRTRAQDDHRMVRLHLTEDGGTRLEALSELHLEELDRLALDLPNAWAGLEPVNRLHGFAGKPTKEQAAASGVPGIGVARVYDDPVPGSQHVLVDRLWPRGLAKEGAPFEEWLKDVAPSTELRKWYGHVPDRFDEFARRYLEELEHDGAREAMRSLRRRARRGGLVLVTATKDVDRSGAAVLRDALVTS